MSENPQFLYDDYGDLIEIETDALATGTPGGGTTPPAILITFNEATSSIRMRLSGGTLAAFRAALDQHAASLAALTGQED